MIKSCELCLCRKPENTSWFCSLSTYSSFLWTTLDKTLFMRYSLYFLRHVVRNAMLTDNRWKTEVNIFFHRSENLYWISVKLKVGSNNKAAGCWKLNHGLSFVPSRKQLQHSD